MLPSKPSTLLPNMNWHDDRPFEEIVRREIPQSPHCLKVEKSLGGLWVDEQYDFHLYKKPTTDTMYDHQIDLWTSNKTKLEEEYKTEDKLFQKLLEKFQEQGVKEEVEQQEQNTTSEEEVDNDITPDTKIKPGGKKPQECKRTLKEKQKHEAMLAKSIKSSMANSQQKLIDLQQAIEILNKQIDAYKHYASVGLMVSAEMRKLVRQYERTHDRAALIRGLDEVFTVEEEFLSPHRTKCSGSGFCSAHYLPLEPARYNSSGLVRDTHCRLTA
jgi:hypothetical protein